MGSSSVLCSVLKSNKPKDVKWVPQCRWTTLKEAGRHFGAVIISNFKTTP